MKKEIRHGVFETNSSSSHSISIAKGNEEFLMDSIIPDEYGHIHLRGGEFGWSWEKFNDALTKANYCAVHASDPANLKRDAAHLKEMLVEVIKDQTGASEVVFELSTDWDSPNHSYIDHQSAGVAQEAFASKETLRNFIFNRNSRLFTGNDNTCPPPNFYDVDGLEYKYELVIEKCNETTKYTEMPDDDKLIDDIRAMLHHCPLCDYGFNRPDRGFDILQQTKIVGRRKKVDSFEGFKSSGKVKIFKIKATFDLNGDFTGYDLIEEIALEAKVIPIVDK